MGNRSVWWAVGTIVVLAGLDLCGAYLAKEFSIRPRWMVYAGGLVAFGLLFVIYAKSLRVTELWIVTFGWVGLLEVGVLVIDRLQFGTTIPRHKLVLAAVIVSLQVVLMLPSRHHPAPPTDTVVNDDRALASVDQG